MMPQQPPPETAPGRPVDAVVVAVVTIFGLFLGVNGVMLWFTLGQPPQLVTPAYYSDAQQVDRVLAAQQAQDRLGWHINVLPGSGTGALAFQVTDAQGKPLQDIGGTVSAYRPSDAALDQKLEVREQPMGSGWYQAVFANPRHGLWRLTLELQRGTDRLHRTIEWTAP